MEKIKILSIEIDGLKYNLEQEQKNYDETFADILSEVQFLKVIIQKLKEKDEELLNEKQLAQVIKYINEAKTEIINKFVVDFSKYPTLITYLKEHSEIDFDEAYKFVEEKIKEKLQSQITNVDKEQQEIKQNKSNGYKKCNKCKIEKPFDDFWKSKSTEDKYRNYCIKCETKNYKEWSMKNKDKTKKVVCNRCGKQKNLIHCFYGNKTTELGFDSTCKVCRKKILYNNRQRKKEELNKYKKIIVEQMIEQPEIKISQTNNEIPLNDSNEVVKDAVDNKITKNWTKFFLKRKD